MSNDPKYIRHRLTGAVYDFNPAALKRSENDFEPYDGPEKEKTAPVSQEGAEERAAAILAAVKSIDPAAYSAAAGGRPAMPKVGAISEIVKFKVSGDEVAAAVLALIEPKE